MTQQNKNRQNITVTIDYTDPDSGMRFCAAITGPKLVFEAAAADNDLTALEGPELFDALIARDGITPRKAIYRNKNAQEHDGPNGEAAHREWDENGILRYISRFKNGKPTHRRAWHKNNTLYYKGHYKNGKSHDGANGESAHRRWDENGTLRCETHYKDGQYHDDPNGEPAYREWDENGTLRYEKHYKDGKLHHGLSDEAAHREWDENGTLRCETHYKDGQYHDGPNGEPAYREWDENGTLNYWKRAGEEAVTDPDQLQAIQDREQILRLFDGKLQLRSPAP